jgi:hypothetical protein
MNKTTNVTKPEFVNEHDYILEFIDKAYELEQGWHYEVSFDADTGKVEYNGPFSSNSWSDDPDVVGNLESLSIGDSEGFYQIDKEFVESNDGYGDLPDEFKEQNKTYERYYEDKNSSIITVYDALGYIADESYESEWFQEIFSNMQKKLDGEELDD